MKRAPYVIIFLIALLFSAIGCSSSESNPVSSDGTETDILSLIPDAEQTDNNHQLVGTWAFSFNLESKTVELEPVRENALHLNVAGWIGDPYVVINTIYPNYVVDMDVTISNPFLSDAYDVRGIIFTDDAGHMLDNPDNWTALYDIPGGNVINPFVAFAKEEPNRVFTGHAQHTENFQIFIPPGSGVVNFAIDVSYPANCEEPYAIDNFYHETLYEDGGFPALVSVDVHDWQNDVNSVELYCPEISGQPLIPFTQINSTTWNLDLANNTGAPAGEYVGYIVVKSLDSGSLALYDKVTLSITPGAPIPSNPEIIATLKHLFYSKRIYFVGDYVYISELEDGIKVFDISDPSNPQIVNSLDYYISDLHVQGDYAYAYCQKYNETGLKILDISDPTNPVEVGYYESFYSGYYVSVIGNTAYITAGYHGFLVIDVTDPTNPTWVRIINIMFGGKMIIEGDYLYVLGNGMDVFDISDPLNPVNIGHVALYIQPSRFAIDGDYAYVTSYNYDWFRVVDISDPSDPIEISNLEIDEAYAVDILGNYAFVASARSGLVVVDISNPNEPYIATNLDTLDEALDIKIKDNYAYIADNLSGLVIIDISAPTEPVLTYGLHPFRPGRVYALGNYALCSEGSGLSIVDVSVKTEPEVAFYDKSIKASAIVVRGDYAYIAGKVFSVFDITDIENPVLLDSTDVGYWSINIVIDDNYAYLASRYKGLSIVDISDPYSTELVGQVQTICANDVALFGSYVCVTDYDSAEGSVLNIVDVSDPFDPLIVGQFDTVKAHAVDVYGNYAYVAENEVNVKIVDISDPVNPVLVRFVNFSGSPQNVNVVGEYLYVVSNCVRIYDLSDPTNPSQIGVTPPLTGTRIHDISVNGQYAYAVTTTSMLVIKLW